MMRLIRWWCLFAIVLLLILPVALIGAPWYKQDALSGMNIDVPKPTLTWSAFSDGSYQKAAAAYFNRHFGLRSDYVRLTNQLYYDVFKKSYMYNGTLIMGKQGYIYEKFYFDDYTKPQVTDAELSALLTDVRWLQAKLWEQGKMVCFIITPSKVRTLPEFVPQQYSSLVQNRELPYDRLVKLLADSNVCYVDGQALISAEKAATGQVLFTKGGTHWNDYGASLMGRAMAAKLNERYGLGAVLPEFVSLQPDVPQGTDRDIYDLLNLVKQPSYEATRSVWQFEAMPDKQYSVGFIGGSFCWGLVDFMQQDKLFKQIDVYFYYRLNHARFVEGKRTELVTLDKLAPAEWRGELLAHDIIFVELNSSMPIRAVQEFFVAAKERLQ